MVKHGGQTKHKVTYQIVKQPLSIRKIFVYTQVKYKTGTFLDTFSKANGNCMTLNPPST